MEEDKVKVEEDMAKMEEDDVSSALLMDAIRRRGCADFLRRRGYVRLFSQRRRQREDVGDEMPIAFSLLVYKRPLQVERLLRAIYRPQNL